ncbi:MAG: hypothetical protein MUO26_09850 [Methanotrichaceae archaeon]|nr:hypothetical protein [Methanotrichaceae archaeon]
MRDLYRTLELPGDNPLREASDKLDIAVWEAYYYGMPNGFRNKNTLEFLLQLNEVCAKAEEEERIIQGPGLPFFCKDSIGFDSEDCIEYIP